MQSNKSNDAKPAAQTIASKNGEQATIKRTDLFQVMPTRRKESLTLGQLWADRITRWAGSWAFISIFLVVLVLWMAINTHFLLLGDFDPYPFILLNLFLSCIAAIQAPVILMSQNRDVERDRHRADLDYYINRKAEREIKLMQRELMEIKAMLSKTSKEKELKKIESEIQTIQNELESTQPLLKN